MAFSLKSLLKGKKKSADPVMDDGDDDPFMAAPEEIPASEALKLENQAKKGKKKKAKKGPIGSFLAKLGGKGKNKKGKAEPEADPFDNPELLALIASEVAAIPMPDEIAEDEVEDEAPKHPEEKPAPTDAPPMAMDEEMDDEQPVEEDLPAFMSQPDKDYESMPDFAMPDGPSKSMGYGGDEDDFSGGFPIGGLDDDDRLGRDGDNKRKIGLIAAGIVALALAGGASAWWLMPPSQGGGQMMAEGGSEAGQKGEPDSGGLLPGGAKPLPGDRVSMAMPPPPTAPSTDAAAQDERSLARRPWLNDGTTPLGPQEQQAAAPALAPNSAPNSAPDAGQTPPPPADGPSDGLGDSAGRLPVEQAAAAPDGTPDGSPDKTAEATPTEGHDSAQADAKTTEAAAEPKAETAPSDGSAMAQQSLPKGALPPLQVAAMPEPPEGKLTPPSYEKLPKPKEPAAALAAAPVSDLSRQTPLGMLPVRAPDGRTAWQTYARPFTGDPKKPRIALVVVGLGLNSAATQAAITSLPPEVTLAFTPYAPDLAAQMTAARNAGHEVLIDLPMEPNDFPSRDPGPLAMLTMQGPSENLTRLETVLGKGAGYTGVINRMGSKFTASPDAMRPVLEALGERGLLYVNSTPQAAGLMANTDIAVPMAEAVLTVDQSPFRDGIDGRLNYLLEAAKVRGQVVAVLHPTPLSFARVIAWSQGLTDKGYQLAPVSAAVSGAKS